MSGCTNGLRNTVEQDSKTHNHVYVTAYLIGTANGEKKVEVETDHRESNLCSSVAGTLKRHQPHISSYGGTQKIKKGRKEEDRQYKKFTSGYLIM